MSQAVTEYFSDRADDYERFRPGYPGAAVAYVLEGLEAGARVVDVGCGTGIFTRLLARHGADVTGVEPNDAMRAAAIEAGGGPRYVAGTAEATGLDDGCCHLVTVAQAFHWFDAAASLEEFHRLLRPGGRLALVWNVRDDATPFGAVYADLVRRAKVDAEARGRVVRNRRSGDPETGGHFRVVERRAFPNPHPLTWEQLSGRARSASYFPPAGPLQAELLRDLRAGFDAHQQEGKVVLDQTTEVTVAERVA